MQGERYCLHRSAFSMVFMLASGQMRRESRMAERWSQNLFAESGLDVESCDVLTVLFKAKPTNRILILVSSSSMGSYHSFSGRIVISVAWSMTLYR